MSLILRNDWTTGDHDRGMIAGSRHRAPLPPGPHGRLLTGTAARWGAETLHFMQGLVRQHGAAVRFHFAFGQHAFLFVHPDHYRRILVDNQRNYTKAHPLYNLLSIAVGDGLVTADGDHWRGHRRLMQPAFHDSALGTLDAAVVRRTEEMLERWDRDVGGTDGKIVDVNKEMMALTLGIVGEVLFGQSLTTHVNTVDSAFSSFNEELMSVVSRPLEWLVVRQGFTAGSRRLRLTANTLHAVVDDIIAERSSADSAGSPKDLLGLLMSAHDADTGTCLSHKDLRDEIVTLMLAGHETSANTLTWILYLLGEHTTVEQRVCDELDRVLGDRTVGIRDLENLPITRAVALEALRLFPPIYAFSRRAREDDVLGGYRVPRGAAISLSPYVTHRMPEFWDSPERFLPERFLPPSPPPEEFAFIPFSAGPRGCIGEPLAMTEIVLIVATILRRYRLRLKTGHVVVPLPLLTLRPAGGMPMVRARVA
jgi:cytochrome P450